MINRKHIQPEWSLAYQELRSILASKYICLESVDDFESIAKEFNLNYSIDAIKIAIRFLISEGIIDTKYNAEEKIKTLTRSNRDVGFISDYSNESRSPIIKTIVLELISADKIQKNVQQYINIQHSPLFIHHYHLQLVDNIPHALADSYIPYNLFKDIFSILRDSSVDLFILMKELGYPVTHKAERVYVDMPTPQEQKYLDLLHNKHQQVVRLDCRVWSKSSLVEVCLLCDRADLYEFNYEIYMTP